MLPNIAFMKRILGLLCLLMLIGCSNEQPNLIVSGKVNGLKKGSLYLERLVDTSLIVIDSMVINGDPEFILQAYLEEPEVLYLTLNANNEERPNIAFFASEGTTTIHTTLKRFYHDAKIEGSEQQKMLEEYQGMIKQFNDRNLDLIKAEFDYQNDSLKLDSIRALSEQLIKSKYLYTVNFAMNNKESEVAPYLAVSQVFDANVTYLDTLYNVLPNDIANSRYGIQLKDLIQARKNDTLTN